MTGLGDLETWRQVEEAKWRAVPKLGSEWLCKWTANGKGYWLVLTDGSALWGEARTSAYIHEKAEEWTPCVEAEMEKLLSLVLMDLSQQSVQACWEGRECVVLHVASALMDLMYKWEFKLTRLPDEVYRHHWVLPLLVQVHSQSQKVKQLEAEVKAKTRQLQDLLPDNKKLPSSKKKDVRLEECVEAVVVKGVWSVLQDHLEAAPTITKHLTTLSSKPEAGETGLVKEDKKTITLASSSPTKKTVQEEQKEEQEEKEKLRRAKIREIQQASPKKGTQTKKKKLKLL